MPAYRLFLGDQHSVGAVVKEDKLGTLEHTNLLAFGLIYVRIAGIVVPVRGAYGEGPCIENIPDKHGAWCVVVNLNVVNLQ
jgi:hypothetical protein